MPRLMLLGCGVRVRYGYVFGTNLFLKVHSYLSEGLILYPCPNMHWTLDFQTRVLRKKLMCTEQENLTMANHVSRTQSSECIKNETVMGYQTIGIPETNMRERFISR